MVEVIGIALIAAGALLLLFGAALSVYGVALLGVVLGGGSGFLLAPTIGDAAGVSGAGATALAVGVGAIAGVIVAYSLLKLVVSIAGFAVGSLVGLYVVTDVAGVSGLPAEIGVAAATGLAVAFVSMFLTKTALIGITAFVGAAFASTELTAGDFDTAASDLTADPLVVSVEEPAFLGLFALGVLSQFGLFKLGWFGKIAGVLPGAKEVTDRREDEEAAT